MKRKSQRLRALQVNLHHSRAALAALCVTMSCNNALIQEPWTYKREVKGLKDVGGELIYSRSIQNPRTCIVVKKDIQTLQLMHYCLRDLTAAKIKTLCGRRPREILLGSAYLPYDGAEPPPPREVRQLVIRRRVEGSHFVISCHGNVHHTSHRSSNINNRDESLFKFIMINDLDITNKGNRPTPVTSNRQEVIDITITTFYAGNFIKN
jgi:hypothetical protein